MSAPPAFESITGRLDYPMVVVTVEAGGKRSGCLVGFTTQCSIEPPRFLVCLSDKNHSFRVAQLGATRLVVHLLGPDGFDLARLFGEATGDELDKFARCAWHPGPDGVPVLDDATAWFSGPIIGQHTLGDHTGFLIEVDAAGERHGSGDFLDFQAVKQLDPGHDP